jgi:hypothetical protein
MPNKSCCDEQGHDCLQSDACPIYQQRRRVRAGQPAPPIFLTPVETDEPDELPAWLSALIVFMLMAVVGLMAFAWVVAL